MVRRSCMIARFGTEGGTARPTACSCSLRTMATGFATPTAMKHPVRERTSLLSLPQLPLCGDS